MKKLKKLIFIIFLMCLNIKTSYAAIKITPSETYIGIESSLNLKVANTASTNISWVSSNPNIVTVTDGKIVGINKGEAYVRVSDGLTVALCKVMVIDNYVPVQSIKLSKSGETVLLNNTIKLNPEIYPINASNKVPYYVSSNPGIVSVDSNGNVTAKGLGIANVSVTVENKVVIYNIKVVDSIPLNGIGVNSSVQLKTNGTFQLSVTYNPSDATNKNVSFKSSNPNVATVSGTGFVRAKAPGTATITVTSEDGGHIATSKITVVTNQTSQNVVTTSPNVVTTTRSNSSGNSSSSSASNNNVKLNGISLSKSSLLLKVDDDERLYVSFNPNNATDKNVTWRSSNTRVVAVYTDGRIKAVSPGMATITVISNDGGYEAKCDVTVEEKTPDTNNSEVKSIKLTQNKLDIKKGAIVDLGVIFDPEDVENTEVTWTSNNESVVTVSNGIVRAVSIGKATIKVTSVDGHKEDKCEVTVYSDLPVQEISFERATQSLYVGDELTLKIITVPDNTLLENPIWISDNEDVAIVHDGVVIAVDVGTATITASDVKNEIVASTVIDVTEKPLPKFDVKIDGYNLKFDPSVKNYTLKIRRESKLKITTSYDSYDSNIVTIAGNRDLKNGSIITITITPNKDTKDVYVINIKKKGFNMIYFFVIVSILLAVNLVRIFINSAKNAKKKKR